ncbi:gamma tubulin complex Spc97/GCP2 subunit Alp4 [Coemansia sp. RSA 989]|nr:gamma tubulin complex Spc97/GCP2 subunit Alp4 [Coemansia sp. RSA 1821]KAJ1865801.1 gamma tubulin complex Spc97/GCP2 subunit Alp4 [Coemansia sp. RSA 989]KAJ1875188.1 gamma tubulin complex Spc97/GCP2 subunit Alp4 [Coemansia sp. RSA 990]KAJ2650586.1 gamma tubulin complex Spc97/GCP2 subunit Alp4 [Coemansia sp. RSA 1250]KAJ2671867.1 gamma tubulin complex Spc97/GCP2 subunit Alp4 [Coemansia sp. RSA 1085]
MSGHDYDYGDDFVEVKRGSYSGAHYGEEDYPALRRLQRDRADSVSFTPQDSYGNATHSEAGDSADELAYFSTKHHQFESSFRSIRGRERAPLAPRLRDMRQSMYAHVSSAEVEQEQQGAAYDNDVELRKLPDEQQELAIIEDILSLLIGVSGRYISFRHPAQSTAWRLPLSIEEALIAPMWINPTLAQMANKILPLVLMHRRIEYFTTTYARRQAGVVNQALCAAIRLVLKDYYSMISTLENLERTSVDNNPYTLQQMWYHLYPQMQTFERLMHLVDEIQAKDLPQTKQTSPLEDDGFGTVADKNTMGSEAGDILPGDEDMAASEYSNSDNEESEPSEQFVVRGGYTLNILSELIKLRGGDLSTRRLYEFLLTKASVPFLQMLSYWLQTGELEDSKPANPGGEFMVASDNDGIGSRTFIDTESIEVSDSKLKRNVRRLGFVSVPELTPAFLRPYSTKIVRTGEYLNILRAYGVDLRTIDTPDIASLSLSPKPAKEAVAEPLLDDGEISGLLNPQMLMRQIDQAYLRANQALLGILFKDGQMMAYMGAVKRYLLFEKSDFLTHFLDLAKVEISRQPKDMSINRLQSFLDLALLNPASVSHDDPLKDIVRVSLESVDLIDTLKVINMSNSSLSEASMSQANQRPSRNNITNGTFFGTSIVSDNFLTGDLFIALQLQIPFPFTIVLDKVTLNKYKALSRLLLSLKQTEQNLVASWLINLKLEDPPVSSTASGQDARLEALRRNVFLRIHTMRHRILISVQQILYYCFWDVIEPQWERMSKLMQSAKTVDELCKVHMHHLDMIFQQCGLTAPKLPKIMVELLKRANKFTSTVNKLVSSKSALFRVYSSAKAQNTVSGRLLGEMNKDLSDTETQIKNLQSVVDRLDQLDKYWVEQLKILLKALNHYARKFEESYLTLAVRLDCNRSDDGSVN